MQGDGTVAFYFPGLQRTSNVKPLRPFTPSTTPRSKHPARRRSDGYAASDPELPWETRDSSLHRLKIVYDCASWSWSNVH